jgi:thymidylate synthase (FAD)
MKIKLLSATTQPQRTMAIAARTCYDEFDATEKFKNKSEAECAEWLIDKVLSKKHFSPLEHANFSVLVTGAVHSTMVQIRTHRHLCVQSQSMRFTGKRMLDDTIPIEELFYFPSSDRGKTRDGSSAVEPTSEMRLMYETTRQNFKYLVEDKGVPMERARDFLGSGYLQNFVMSCNLRTYFHLITMRTPKDAQVEVRWFMEDLNQCLIDTGFCPEMLTWVQNKYWGKSHLSF